MKSEHIVTVGCDEFEVTIGGHKISGWSKVANALEMPDTRELKTLLRSDDGKLLISPSNDFGGHIFINLLPNSPSTAFFMQKVPGMLDKGKELNYWDGTVENKSQNYRLILNHGVMTVFPLMPTTNTGANFKFVFRDIIPYYPNREINSKLSGIRLPSEM